MSIIPSGVTLGATQGLRQGAQLGMDLRNQQARLGLAKSQEQRQQEQHAMDQQIDETSLEANERKLFKDRAGQLYGALQQGNEDVASRIVEQNPEMARSAFGLSEGRDPIGVKQIDEDGKYSLLINNRETQSAGPMTPDAAPSEPGGEVVKFGPEEVRQFAGLEADESESYRQAQELQDLGISPERAARSAYGLEGPDVGTTEIKQDDQVYTYRTQDGQPVGDPIAVADRWKEGGSGSGQGGGAKQDEWEVPVLTDSGRERRVYSHSDLRGHYDKQVSPPSEREVLELRRKADEAELMDPDAAEEYRKLAEDMSKRRESAPSYNEWLSQVYNEGLDLRQSRGDSEQRSGAQGLQNATGMTGTPGLGLGLMTYGNGLRSGQQSGETERSQDSSKKSDGNMLERARSDPEAYREVLRQANPDAKDADIDQKVRQVFGG